MVTHDGEVKYQGCSVYAYNNKTGKIYNIPAVQVIEYKSPIEVPNTIAHRDKIVTDIIREDTTAVLGEVVVVVIPF